jgi:hypothetical protein
VTVKGKKHECNSISAEPVVKSPSEREKGLVGTLFFFTIEEKRKQVGSIVTAGFAFAKIIVDKVKDVEPGGVFILFVTEQRIEDIGLGNTFFVCGPIKKWPQGILGFHPLGLVFYKRAQQMKTLVIGLGGSPVIIEGPKGRQRGIVCKRRACKRQYE